MEVWIVVHDYYQLCVLTLICPSGHMTSIHLSILERFLSISWEFFLIRCEVKGQGCCMCTDCKAP